MNFVSADLENLDLSYNNFGVEGCKKLGIFISHAEHLKKLNIEGTEIGDHGLKSIIEGVMKHKKI